VTVALTQNCAIEQVMPKAQGDLVAVRHFSEAGG
jgi:hypothetical protein